MLPLRLALVLASALLAEPEARDGKGFCEGWADFKVRLGEPVGRELVGFGGQMNHSLYSKLGESVGITDRNRWGLERKLKDLAPQHVRVFLDQAWLDQARGSKRDCDALDSFARIAALARDAGATVNVTYWKGGGYPEPRRQMLDFAGVLGALVTGGGDSPLVTRCGWKRALGGTWYATIQNEPNGDESRAVNIEGPRPGLYAELHRALHEGLQARGVRRRVKLIGGDLVARRQREWLSYMGRAMADVLDGYSVHIYWEFWDRDKPLKRLVDVKKLVDSLPKAARKPLFITEYGVRGRGHDGPDPGRYEGGRPVRQAPEVALQEAAFALLAAQLGYVAALKWDLYVGRYNPGDKVMLFGAIGSAGNEYRTHPFYRALRLLTHSVPGGWRAVKAAPAWGGTWLAAFRGGAEAAAVLVNEKPCRRRARVAGLPRRRPLFFLDWNADGEGRLRARAPANGADGSVEVLLEPMTVSVLSTRAPNLGL